MYWLRGFRDDLLAHSPTRRRCLPGRWWVPATTWPPVRLPGVSTSMMARVYIMPADGPPTMPVSMSIQNGSCLT